MVRRWVCYALALAGALAFRVVYTGWLAGFLLAFLLCLPPVGVLVSLPAVLSCRLGLGPFPAAVRREEAGYWQVSGRSVLGLPLGRVRVTVETVNQMTGQRMAAKAVFALPGGGGGAKVPVPADHCGCLEGHILSAWAADCLGLFYLPVRRGAGALLTVLPREEGEELPPLPEEEAPGMRPRPGGGPGEDYDPRPYRPGDPLNTIHWKLSAKRDELVTRETLEDVKALPLITLDHFGPPEAMDRVLDRLAGLGRGLLGEGRAFTVAWADPATGAVRSFPVSGAGEWSACLGAALSQPAPLTGRSILDAPGMKRALHLSGAEEGRP